MNHDSLAGTSVIVALLLSFAGASAQLAPPPDEARTLGTPVPDVTLTDDAGITFQLSDLSGKPLIISPIFTRCPHVCPAITQSLLDAVRPIDAPGEHYNVLTVSFDPADTPEDMAAYRDRLELPGDWRLAVIDSANGAALFGAIDFNYAVVDGGGFAHANLVAFVKPTLELSSYLHGMMYTEEDVRKALHTAASRQGLLARSRPLLIIVALGAALSALGVIVLSGRKKPRPA